ncbi:4-coumarate--CoA ligase [Acanthopleuribacter pedis]|uniref:4-coumarate--CoA ligase n=1 Tax=Acanthopleuribacter pedis TaxID=442870 RepID=A0A8J7QCM3_9BACT|nr:4-coumarate--CoA ligase [Acanthopleuribacter pedis]MBO1321669.1 4-coumarate--CoA ligase [Acanthopleuribacter pedis]
MDFSTFLDARGFPLPETTLGGDGYPLDSLSLMELAGHIARTFHLTELGVEDYLLRRRTLQGWVDLVHEGWREGLNKITFSTSGSTGRPQPVTHARETLLQETAHLATLFPRTQRVVAAVPAHHIYGFLFTVLLPQQMGVPLLEARALGARALYDALEDGDLIISHPFQWRYLGQLWPDLTSQVEGVTSTAPCPEATAALLRERGLTRLTEVYGSSESGGLGARDQHGTAYQLFPYWRPADDGDDPLLIRTLPDGTGIEVEASDLLEWETSERFHVVGRRDGAVQVGGHNVFPVAVARILLEHPEVANCAVRLMKPEEGTRLKAFIVPAEDRDLNGLPARLHAWCARELRAPQRPTHFRLGPALPRTAMGKAADWSID